MFLTKTKTPIIGQVAMLLGVIMNGIFIVQSKIGIENIGLCIILFTLVIYLLMTPLTIQQQKFSKMSAKMQPEISAIQKKYKGKNGDQAAMQKMNEETQAVYAKYGVNPMGSCLQLVIQMPILFALYRVIWNIPAYVDRVKSVFIPLSESLMKLDGAADYLGTVAKSVSVSFPEMNTDTIIDVLYKFKPANWEELTSTFPDLSESIASTQKTIDKMNSFMGLNIADSPMNIIMSAAKSGAILLLIGAVMVPLLAAVTQWLNAKLMTVGSDQNNAQSDNGTMAQSMKTMNTVMPLMSAFFCLTLPVGMGIYWIAGAVIRSIQQVVINKRLEKVDFDEMLKKNIEKENEKRAKRGLPPQKMTNNATISTRNIDTAVNKSFKPEPKRSLKEKADGAAADKPETYTSKKYKEGSLASKAFMVQEYNEKHQKK